MYLLLYHPSNLLQLLCSLFPFDWPLHVVIQHITQRWIVWHSLLGKINTQSRLTAKMLIIKLLLWTGLHQCFYQSFAAVLWLFVFGFFCFVLFYHPFTWFSVEVLQHIEGYINKNNYWKMQGGKKKRSRFYHSEIVFEASISVRCSQYFSYQKWPDSHFHSVVIILLCPESLMPNCHDVIMVCAVRVLEVCLKMLQIQ